jgi:hypothetical protein
MKWTTSAPIRAAQTHEGERGGCQGNLALLALFVLVAGFVLEAVWR